MPEILKGANVRLHWTPSVSTDVTEQKLVINANSVEIVNTGLVPAATQFDFQVNEQDQLVIDLRSFDGTNESVPAILEVTIPDLSIPLSPLGLNIEILNIFDLPI